MSHFSRTEEEKTENIDDLIRWINEKAAKSKKAKVRIDIDKIAYGVSR